MKYWLRIPLVYILMSGAAYAQGNAPIATERLTITGSGSTGDVSGMTVAPKLGPPPSSLDTLLSSAPVSFSKYGAGGQPGVDATAAFAAIRGDTTAPTVFLPSGQYEISACPTDPYFQSSVNLVGAGKGRTRIKFTGPGCTGNLFAWGGGLSDFGLRDMTIDWNGAPCTASDGVCSSLYITNNTRARIENVDFIGYTGDNWFGVQIIGSSDGIFRGNRIQPQDCNVKWRSSLGLIFGGYTLGSSRTGSIAGNVITVEAKDKSPESTEFGSPITIGQAVTGGPTVPRDLYVVAFGTGAGEEGTYILNKAVPNTVAKSKLYFASTFGWMVENNKIVNTILNYDAPMLTSRNNSVGPYCAGAGIATSYQAAWHTSIEDTVFDGPSVAGDDIYDTGFELHGPNTLIANSRVFNVSQSCLSFSGGRTIVQGGTCSRFNTGALQDAAFTGSIDGSVLTVTSVASGAMQSGQIIDDGTGQQKLRIVTVGTGTGGPGTYNLSGSRSVESRTMTSATPGSYSAVFASNGDEGGSNSLVADYTVQGSGTPGERNCYADSVDATGIILRGMHCNGISGMSPYRIAGTGTTVAELAPVMAKGVTVYDGAAPKYAAGLVTENNGDRINLGINDFRFGTQITADEGAFLRMQPGAFPLQLYYRARGANAAQPILTFLPSGGISGDGWFAASGYTSAGLAGVSCSGPPAASFQVTNGVVTRC